MTEYTIAHEYTLPSNGELYNEQVNPQFKLRSMTTAEEMKRLNHTDRPYSVMAEIIDDCLVTDLGISAYDLCLADYQYMLNKLRIVTYGPSYKITTTCPFCGTTNRSTLDLETMNVVPFDKDYITKYSEFTLPSTGKNIKLRMQTPRILDDITYRSKEERRKNQQLKGDPAFLLSLQYLIDTIDGEHLEEFKIIPFLNKLPMMDTNYILKCAEHLVNAFGIDSSINHTCPICRLDYKSNFRTTAEFYGPSID